MNHSDESIFQLVQACRLNGLKNIVISPGSRNAPIVNEFVNNSEFNCYSIVDERSAAFFALGIAQQEGKATILLCTSGTAVLNYAPAIAEAFYQKVPLLAITADRPREWVNQGESQTIDQIDIYRNYVKSSYSIIQDPENEQEKNENISIISSALRDCFIGQPGPVHINIPLDEPLYKFSKKTFKPLKIPKSSGENFELSTKEVNTLIEELSTFRRPMILCGANRPNETFNERLSEFASAISAVVLTETNSNLYHPEFIMHIDRLLATFQQGEDENLKPDLLITFGDQVISKRIKNYLRNNKPKAHWHVDPYQKNFDTYRSLSKTVATQPIQFLSQLKGKVENNDATYFEHWKSKRIVAEKRHENFRQTAPYSDFNVFDILLNQLPDKTILHMGNSSPVRYIQLFPQNPKTQYFSNRGTSGIEGCTSTAVGASQVNNDMHVLITGDLAFLYDNNALWNAYLKSNLKVVVINNGGGGIFRIIEGPDTVKHFEQFIATEQKNRMDLLAKMHGLEYFYAGNRKELNAEIPKFLNEKMDQPAILEIETPREINAEILRNYFTFIKDGK